MNRDHRTLLGMRSGILLLAGVAALLTGVEAQTPAPAARSSRTSTGLLLGRVLDGHSSRPVPGAIVSLNGPAGAPQKVQADGEGRFLFTRLPDGEFMLSATKAGYLGGMSGQRVPSGPGRPIPLGPGERIGDAVIRMWKYAAISGTVRGDGDEPAVAVEVRLVERILVEGRRVLAPGPYPGAITDDRGVYRFSTVAPGEYVVFARSPVEAGQRVLMSIAMTDQSAIAAVAARAASGHLEDAVDVDSTLRVYPPTFYPAASSPSDAELIRIRAGEERTGVDIRSRLVGVGRVAGTVLHQGQPQPSARLRLSIAGAGEPGIEVASATSGRDGHFSMTGVPVGQYSLRAARAGRSAGTEVFGRDGLDVSVVGARGLDAAQPDLPTDPTLWLARPTAVGDPDAMSLSLEMRPGARIRGRVDFSGSAGRPAPEQLAQFRLTVVSAGPPQPDPALGALFGRIEPDGTFTTVGLVPGSYRLRVSAPPPWRATSATIGGVDLLDTAIAVESADVDDVMIALVDSAAGTISGMVRNDRGAADADAVVVILPADERLIGDRRMKIARTTKAGVYSVPNLPAGEYVIALSSDERLQIGLDRQETSRLIQGGARVTLGDGERRTIDLRSEGSR